MWNNSVITNNGAQLLAQWLEGTTLHITGAAVGEGRVSPSQLRSQTALVNEKKAMNIVESERIDAGIRLKLQVSSEGVTQGFTINQVGVYAQLDDGPTRLLSLYQDDDGIEVPTEAQMPDFVFTFWAVIATNNEGTLTVEVSPAIQIDVIDNLSSTSSTDALSAKQGKVLDEKIAEKISAEEKGEADGVATLDETGKIPTEQLPDINLSDLSDVEIASPTDKQALVYNAQTGKWENGASAMEFKLLPVTHAAAVSGDAEVSLTWVNPSDVIIGGTVVAEYDKTKIVRKIGSAPTSVSDGTVVYDNNGESFTDSGLVNDTTYYYAFYPYTTKNVFSDAVTVSAIPTIQTVEITLTIEGAKEDTIAIEDSNGDTIGTCVFGSGQTSASATLNIKSGGEDLIFVSSVAKDTVSGTNPYAKQIHVTSATASCKVMPEGALYWYGNKISVENVSTSNGWVYNAYTFSEPTWNTNSVSISANNGNASAVGTTNAVVKGTYTMLHVGITSNTVDHGATHSGAIVGALTGKSLPPATWQDNNNMTSSEWTNSYHDISAPLGTGDNYCLFWCSPNNRSATAVCMWLE